ncbi:hypothetical protein PMSD_21140 [Paenibacillus macquariensis subsp. defensor]|nr:hypothetical protein PMSD_21140 [Paenibacillus macquariensis subsp. defensor]
MAHNDNQELDYLLLTEEEEHHLTKDIDFDRVKSITLQQINRRESFMNKNKGTRKYKTFIIAAAMVATLSTTVFAGQYFDGFKQFFGGSASIPESDRSSIQQSTVVSNVKMTAEESVLVGNSGYLIVTFTKEDGTAFPADAVVPQLGISATSYMVSQQLVDNNKKLIGLFEMASLDIEGFKATITADKITTADGTQVVKGPWEIDFTITSGKQKIKDINLAIENEKLTVTKVSVSSIGVAIEGKTDDTNNTLPEYAPEVKAIAADGKEIILNCSSTSPTKNGFQWLYNMDIKHNYAFLGDMDIKSVIIDGTTFDMK